MTRQIPAKEFRNNFSSVLTSVSEHDDTVVITKFDKPAAVLVDFEIYQKMKGCLNTKPKKNYDARELLMGLTKLGIKVPKGTNLSTNYKKYLYDE